MCKYQEVVNKIIKEGSFRPPPTCLIERVSGHPLLGAIALRFVRIFATPETITPISHPGKDTGSSRTFSAAGTGSPWFRQGKQQVSRVSLSLSFFSSRSRCSRAAASVARSLSLSRDSLAPRPPPRALCRSHSTLSRSSACRALVNCCLALSSVVRKFHV